MFGEASAASDIGVVLAGFGGGGVGRSGKTAGKDFATPTVYLLEEPNTLFVTMSGPFVSAKTGSTIAVSQHTWPS